MGYLTEEMVLKAYRDGTHEDPRALLADIDREAVYKAVQNSKDGLMLEMAFTTMPIEHPELQKMSPGDRRKLDEASPMAKTHPGKALPILMELLMEYPKVPAIYNYISTAYAFSGRNEDRLDVIQETIKRFPGYLFGKTALAEYYLETGNHREIPKIFDGQFDLRRLYPDVEVFHISEVRAFFSVMARYFARVGNISRALYYYFFMERLEPENPAIKVVAREIVRKEMDRLMRSRKKGAGKRR